MVKPEIIDVATIEVLQSVDMELLDQQITHLHDMEVCDALSDQEDWRESLTGLCNFLSDLYNALGSDNQ